jgi:Fe-S oxidoreductase
MARGYEQNVTYHDPCYLGRHNGIFEQPRDVLKHIPDTDVTEMAENRQNSFCCGGGGGRIWMETPKGERFSDLRLQQALATGATTLVTACPYCLTNFTDSSLGLNGDRKIEIKDITEVIAAVI